METRSAQDVEYSRYDHKVIQAGGVIFTAATTFTLIFTKDAKGVKTVYVPPVTGAAGAGAAAGEAVPAGYVLGADWRPKNDLVIPLLTTANATNLLGKMVIATTGAISIYAAFDELTNWAGAGNNSWKSGNARYQ
jgi:hypothetical protein